MIKNRILDVVLFIFAMSGIVFTVASVVLFLQAIGELAAGQFTLGAKLALAFLGAVLGAYICASAAVGVEEILFWRKRRRQ
jgi:hypothetical protein